MTLRSHQPGPSPEGKLLRLARDAQGFSIRYAASLAEVSETHWRHVETGFESKAGMRLPVGRSSPAKLARMMNVVGVSPERLATEGQRPDAAEILREIKRRESGNGQARGDSSPEGLMRRLETDGEMDEDLKRDLRQMLGALLREGDERRANGGEGRRRA